MLLGRVIAEQAGTSLFDLVEQLRSLLIQHRDAARSGAEPGGQENRWSGPRAHRVARRPDRVSRRQGVRDLL